MGNQGTTTMQGPQWWGCPIRRSPLLAYADQCPNDHDDQNTWIPIDNHRLRPTCSRLHWWCAQPPVDKRKNHKHPSNTTTQSTSPDANEWKSVVRVQIAPIHSPGILKILSDLCWFWGCWFDSRRSWLRLRARCCWFFCLFSEYNTGIRWSKQSVPTDPSMRSCIHVSPRERSAYAEWTSLTGPQGDQKHRINLNNSPKHMIQSRFQGQNIIQRKGLHIGPRSYLCGHLLANQMSVCSVDAKSAPVARTLPTKGLVTKSTLHSAHIVAGLRSQQARVRFVAICPVPPPPFAEIAHGGNAGKRAICPLPRKPCAEFLCVEHAKRRIAMASWSMWKDNQSWKPYS